MKNVLILAFDFPPFPSVGGLRPFSWYQGFLENGLYPIVVTRQWVIKYNNRLDYLLAGWSKGTVIEENEKGLILRTAYEPNLSNKLFVKYGPDKYRFLRKAITGWFEFSQFLWLTGTKVQLYQGARLFLQKNKVDAIIATGDPFILFRYAYLLGKEFDLPWIVDYRDPWIQDKSRSSNRLTKFWDAMV